MNETKICSRCKIAFPPTSEYFSKHKQSKDGLSTWCKACSSQYQKQWYSKNAEYVASYAVKNKESILNRNKAYQTANREMLLEKRKQYHKNHEESEKKCRKLYDKLHRKEITEQRKGYRKAHGKELKDSFVKWAKNNPFKIKVYRHKRRMMETQADCTLTENQWEQIKEHFENRCAYCGKPSFLEQEHFVSVIKGGEYTHNNIIPACRSCNSSKRDRSFFNWYPKQPFYSIIRERRILKFLNYKNETQQLVFCCN